MDPAPAPHRLGREDLVAALQLAVLTLIVMPLAPDRDMGPYDALNPRRIWTFVVLLAAISFAGYVAVRLLGAHRGTAVTAAFGGLVSSTAVALEFSRRSAQSPELSRPLAAGVVLASTLMFPRVLVVAGAGCPDLVPRLAPCVGLTTAAGAVASVLLYRGTAGADPAGPVALRNPLGLVSALKFAAFIAFIGLASRAAAAAWGDAGLYAVAAVSGLADVDGLTVAVAGEASRAVHAAGAAGDPPFLATAARVLVVAMLANTVVKGALVAALGSPEARRLTVRSMGAVLAAGAGALLIP